MHSCRFFCVMHSRVKNKIDVTSSQNRLPRPIYDNCYIISELLEAEELVTQEPNATTFLSNLEKAPYVCFAGAKTTDETGSVFLHLKSTRRSEPVRRYSESLGRGTNDIAAYLKMLHLL